MKKKLLLYMLFICSLNLNAQKMNLNDLMNICNQSSWESVNQIMISKNWVFYESTKGDKENYNTITWSYEKSTYDDKAQAWLFLYTYEKKPEKLKFIVFNAETYKSLQTSLNSYGFKLIDSKIDNDFIVSNYSNNKFTLLVSTSKREDNESVVSSSHTVYNFTLLKRNSIYDTENGKKMEYYENGNIESEFSLSNGKLNGTFKLYYENGIVKKTGTYLNGLANGTFIEYNLNSYKTDEYQMQNDKLNGLYTSYEYNRSGILIFKTCTNYIDNKEDGMKKTFLIDGNKESLMSFINYSSGVKNGDFQINYIDSLITGTYNNDKLNGEYRVYIDHKTLALGGLVRTELNDYSLIEQVTYLNDKKTGYWKVFDLSGKVAAEGRYENDKRTGEWRYYHYSQLNIKSQLLPCANQLYLIENYSNGELNGKSIRYSYIQDVKIPCINSNKNDTCYDSRCFDIYETSYFLNNKLEGPYELRDSKNCIVSKGDYRNGLKTGEWIQRYTSTDINDSIYYYYEKGVFTNGLRDGKWCSFYKENKITRTYTYKNGKLNGEYTIWNKYNKPKEKRVFANGELKELTIYDSIGNNKLREYEILEISDKGIRCKKIEWFNTQYSIQEYYFKLDGELKIEMFDLLFSLNQRNFSTPNEIYKDGEFILFQSNVPVIKGKYCKNKKCDEWRYDYPLIHVYCIKSFNQDNLLNERYYDSESQELYSGKIELEEDGVVQTIKIKKGLKQDK